MPILWSIIRRSSSRSVAPIPSTWPQFLPLAPNATLVLKPFLFNSSHEFGQFSVSPVW